MYYRLSSGPSCFGTNQSPRVQLHLPAPVVPQLDHRQVFGAYDRQRLADVLDTPGMDGGFCDYGGFKKRVSLV